MRITFVLPFAALSGGVRVIATYARVLTEQGHEVFVVSPARSQKGRLRRAWLRLSGRGHKIKVKQASPLLGFLGERHIQFNPDRPFDPSIVPDADAVFATWWRTAERVAALPASKGHKFYMLQGYEVFPPHPPAEVIATYHLPLHKIAVSSYIRNEIEQKHDVSGIEVIPNAVDTAQFSAPKRGKQKVMTVGFLYNILPQKRVEVAIEAIKLARAQVPDLRVIVFAGLPPSPKIPLPDWVEFHQAPPQAEIPGLYQSCDLWLFPSAQEGFGLPILEAMASRTPVVATPAGAASDLIDDTNGVLLPAGSDAQAFCDQILTYAALPESQWQARAQAAHETAQRNDWQQSSKRLSAEIADAIAGSKI